VYGVNQLLSGTKLLDELIDAVQTQARYERLIDQLQLTDTNTTISS